MKKLRNLSPPLDPLENSEKIGIFKNRGLCEKGLAYKSITRVDFKTKKSTPNRFLIHMTTSFPYHRTPFHRYPDPKSYHYHPLLSFLFLVIFFPWSGKRREFYRLLFQRFSETWNCNRLNTFDRQQVYIFKGPNRLPGRFEVLQQVEYHEHA